MAKNDYKQIRIVIKNPPTKERARERTKELGEFLSKTWRLPLGKG